MISQYIEIETFSKDTNVIIQFFDGHISVNIDGYGKRYDIIDDVEEIEFGHRSHGVAIKRMSIQNWCERHSDIEVTLSSMDCDILRTEYFKKINIETSTFNSVTCFSMFLYLYNTDIDYLVSDCRYFKVNDVTIKKLYLIHIKPLIQISDDESVVIENTNHIHFNFGIVNHDDLVQTFNEFFDGNNIPHEMIDLLVKECV